ncbi:MAG: ROK family protein [Treponema sp.]|nr:ROK family protein [Treponema sp.]
MWPPTGRLRDTQTLSKKNNPRFLIGIDAGGTNIKIMIMTSRFEVTAFNSIPTGCERGYEIVSDAVIAEIERMFAENGIGNPAVAAVAMGLPGTVFSVEQKTGFLSVLMWNDFNPCKKIGEHFNAVYRIDNDANLNALGEYRFGIREQVENMILLTIGTGVGGGIIINRQLYRGIKNQAAEFGHMTIAADSDEICLCGQYGHFESYCSGSALKRYTLKHLPDYPRSLLNSYMAEKGGYDNAMIDRGVMAGDPFCTEVFNRYIKYFAIGIGNLMKLFNPELIVIAGGIANAGELLLAPLREQARTTLMDPDHQGCPIKKSLLGTKAGVYGACALAAETAGL